MEIDRGIQWVVEYLELGGYHDHVLLLMWVYLLVYQGLLVLILNYV